jgi:hypothetical protein
MNEVALFNSWLAQNMLVIFLSIIGLNVLLIILFLAAHFTLKKYKNLLKRAEGKDLEPLLLELLEKTNQVFRKQQQIEDRLTNNQILAERHLQNWSLVRFQAFENTGGDQSFAFAMLDALGDGIVMSSIFGREEARVYCKPVQKGSSIYPLSDEEKEAIDKAISGVAKKTE